MTYITIFVVVVSAAVVLKHKKKDYMLLPEKIEQLMNSTPMKCYKNSFYGYTVHYPSFFEQTPDSLKCIKHTQICTYQCKTGKQYEEDYPM